MRGRAWVRAIEETRVLSDEANASYYAQDDPRAAIALTRMLEHLESVTAVTEPWTPRAHPFLKTEQLAFDRALTASRLALVQERLGQSDAAVATWTRAQSHARTANAANLDLPSLRELVRRLDESARSEAR